MNHQGQFPVGDAVVQPGAGRRAGRRGDARSRPRRASSGCPPSIHGSFQGTAQAFQASLASEPLLILAALVTVYIVLGMLYESYIHPITILSTLPSAGVGALLALLVCGTELTVIALIGIILLIGIVKKNAIMMIDFALEAERSEGKSPAEAIYQACLLRFRPIMMTTMAALLGALPLALGSGVGVGAAAAARHRHRRRADRQPDADAVHDAGRLPLSRPLRGSGWRGGARTWAVARARRRPGVRCSRMTRRTVRRASGSSLALARQRLRRRLASALHACGPDYVRPSR